LKRNSPTEVGQTSQTETPNQSVDRTALIDALNQCFTLFELNYHNQFLKAYSPQEKLNTAKRLWLDALQDQPPEKILLAAQSVIKSTEFLPTLKTMLDHCEHVSGIHIPDAHSAYQEACCAASPKIEQNWSHPIVYFAGKETGWHFLQHNAEYVAFPIFKEHFNSLSEQVRTGLKLKIPEVKKIEEAPAQAATEETKEKYLSSLKNLLE